MPGMLTDGNFQEGHFYRATITYEGRYHASLDRLLPDGVAPEDRAMYGLPVRTLTHPERSMRVEVEEVTPPRPPEPEGIGAVVEDALGELWASDSQGRGGARWNTREKCRSYGRLDIVRVLSEGVTR